MHPIEANILMLIEKDEYIPRSFSETLHSLPLGKLSREFYENPSVTSYCKKNGHEMLGFRLALEKYLAPNHSQNFWSFLPWLPQRSLKNIEAAMLKLPSPMSHGGSEGMQNKAAGTYLIPVPNELIRQVYLLDDMTLIDLFKKHFPVPPSQLFDKDQVPGFIKEREQEASKTIKKIALKTLEPFIIKAQRSFRMKKRHQEELNRITLRDASYLKSSHMTAEDFLQDVNTPYKPKCKPELSKRIVTAAGKISAFSTVKHITSEKALPSIFNEALYGRTTLMNFYLAFDPASLYASDILNGDANVVCLGPQNIDPKAHGGIVIEFDLPKLIKNKPSAFYKQRDLEYQTNSRIRQVLLGDETISFDQSGDVRCADATSTYLKIIDTRSGSIKQVAEAPKSSFIAYNLEQIHEILTLNFFRFLDKMTDLDRKLDQAYIDNFYQKINKLTDDELVRFLTDLEKNMTDTAEFNFYGAHQVDFSTILSISARRKKYTLNLSEFIAALKLGNIEELRLARTMIPELFQSYRFVDYLLSKIKHAEVGYYLDDLRKQCKTPDWVQYTPLSIRDEFNLHWEASAKPIVDTQKAPFVEKETVLNTDKIIGAGSEIPENTPSPASLDQSDAKSQKIIDDHDEFQQHQDQFETILERLRIFLSYCSESKDPHVSNYQSFVQHLKNDFSSTSQRFFSNISIKDQNALTSSFDTFRSECERLCRKAEKHFKPNAGLWSQIKLILMGFLGVLIAIAVTLLTLGIATYQVAKNERLRDTYVDTFFRSEPEAVKQTKNQWAQYAIKQTLFGNRSKEKGLVQEVKDTINKKPNP